MESLCVCAVPSVHAHQVDYLNKDILFEAGSTVALTWTPSNVFPLEKGDAYNIDVTLFGLLRQDNVTSWTEISQVATNTTNSGKVNVTIPELPLFHNHSSYLVIAFQVTLSPLSYTSQSYDWSTVRAGIWTSESYFSYGGKPSRERCVAWAGDVEAREAERSQLSSLPPCPCNHKQARAPNSGFQETLRNDFLNPKAAVCYYKFTSLKT